MLEKKNPNVQNHFINRNKIKNETLRAIKVKAPVEKNNIFVWFAKEFVKDGKYPNSVCIGIIKNAVYELIFRNEITNEEFIYDKVTGITLLEMFEKQKQEVKKRTYNHFSKKESQ